MLFLTIVETIASPAGTVKQAIIDLLINHKFDRNYNNIIDKYERI